MGIKCASSITALPPLCTPFTAMLFMLFMLCVLCVLLFMLCVLCVVASLCASCNASARALVARAANCATRASLVCEREAQAEELDEMDCAAASVACAAAPTQEGGRGRIWGARLRKNGCDLG